MITALVIAGRHHRYFLVGWLWFLGTLIPMIGLVQVGAQAMADRYAYLPFIGLFIMICWGVAEFQPAGGSARSEWTEEGHTSSTWLTIACLGMLLALAAVAHQQLWYWRNSAALWEHAAEVTRGNWMAEDMLGSVMLEAENQTAASRITIAHSTSTPTIPSATSTLGTGTCMRASRARPLSITRRCSAHRERRKS